MAQCTFGNEEGVELLHHASLHDGVDKSHFFGQLLGSERVLNGDVLLVVVEQSLECGEGWLGKVGKWVADDNSIRFQK